MQHASQRKQSRLLLAGCAPRYAADPHIDLFPVVVSYDIRLGSTLGQANHRHPMLIIHLNFFIERKNHRMDIASENRIHDPGLQILSMDPGDRSIVLYAQENFPPLKIGKCHHLLGQLLRADIVALELDSRVLAVGN